MKFKGTIGTVPFVAFVTEQLKSCNSYFVVRMSHDAIPDGQELIGFVRPVRQAPEDQLKAFLKSLGAVLEDNES